MTPKALIKMKRGTGFLTFGTFTTIWLLVYFVEGLTILIDKVLTGFEASSDTERISALWL